MDLPGLIQALEYNLEKTGQPDNRRERKGRRAAAQGTIQCTNRLLQETGIGQPNEYHNCDDSREPLREHDKTNDWMWPNVQHDQIPAYLQLRDQVQCRLWSTCVLRKVGRLVMCLSFLSNLEPNVNAFGSVKCLHVLKGYEQTNRRLVLNNQPTIHGIGTTKVQKH